MRQADAPVPGEEGKVVPDPAGPGEGGAVVFPLPGPAAGGACGRGCLPQDRALGLEGRAITPGMANVLTRTVPLMGFAAAGGHIADLAGVKAPSGPLQRRAMDPGAEAMESGLEEVVDGRPLESRGCLSVDGTEFPMRGEEVEGVAGKREDVSAGTREAKLAVV